MGIVLTLLASSADPSKDLEHRSALNRTGDDHRIVSGLLLEDECRSSLADAILSELDEELTTCDRVTLRLGLNFLGGGTLNIMSLVGMSRWLNKECDCGFVGLKDLLLRTSFFSLFLPDFLWWVQVVTFTYNI